MASLTSTKQGRLAIIVIVAIVIAAGAAIFNGRLTASADDKAHDFARVAHERLEGIDHDDLDELAADFEVSTWSGETDSPFWIEDQPPERLTEVADGFVARYRIHTSGTERCVDALWPDDGTPVTVRVNKCEGYDRP